MDAQNVVEKIKSDAQQQVDKINRETQRQSEVAQAQLDEEMKNFNEETLRLAQKAADDENNHALAAARMEIARDLLAQKRDLLDAVFKTARKKILEMPDDQYRDLMTKLLTSAVETGNEQVIIDTNEKRIDQALIKKVNNQLSDKGHLSLSDEKREIGAGFILKRGNIQNNATVDVLIDQARENLEIEMAKNLFGEQK